MIKEIFTFITICVILCSCAKKNGTTSVQESDFVFVQGNENVSDFYICEHEVTQAEYQAIMGVNPSKTIDDNNPVDGATWYEAVEYCNKRSEEAGLTPCYSGLGEKTICNFDANGYRLPTETEWKYAA